MTVSVCMITYNHEKFILEAIEGVLMQQTNFEIELIICNDNSTDDSNAIILERIRNSGKININYFFHAQNKGMIPNFIFALQKCTGKYITLCDGDDYWTDPLKLQKQVDFMEGNPDFGICFHKVQIYNQQTETLEEDTITRSVPDITDIIDLAKCNYIHTPSVLLRNDFSLPKWFRKAVIGDWTLYMISIKDRKIKKIEDIMAVYRLHEKSIWSNKDQLTRNILTKANVELVYNNLKISNISAREILKNRIGIKDTPIKKTVKKLVKKILKTFQ